MVKAIKSQNVGPELMASVLDLEQFNRRKCWHIASAVILREKKFVLRFFQKDIRENLVYHI